MESLSELVKTSATGFEPVRAEPMRFRVSLLNHSDKLTVVFKRTTWLLNSGSATRADTCYIQLYSLLISSINYSLQSL